MEDSTLPLDILERFVLPRVLNKAWDGYSVGPVVSLRLVCKDWDDLLFGSSSVKRKECLWGPLFRGNQVELFITLKENYQRMSIPVDLVNATLLKGTYRTFPSLLVAEKGLMWVLKSRFRFHNSRNSTAGTPMRYVSSLLTIEAQYDGGNPPKFSGCGSFVDSRGRYGEGQFQYELVTARNDWGMRTYVSVAQITDGLVVLPGGTQVQGTALHSNEVEGSRTFSNGVVRGRWTLSRDEKREVFEFVALAGGQMTLDSADVQLPDVLTLTGRFESPNPLDQPVRGPLGAVFELSESNQRYFLNEKDNVIEVSSLNPETTMNEPGDDE